MLAGGRLVAPGSYAAADTSRGLDISIWFRAIAGYTRRPEPDRQRTHIAEAAVMRGRTRRTAFIGLIGLATAVTSLGTDVFRSAQVFAANPASSPMAAPADAELTAVAAQTLPPQPVPTAADLDPAALSDKAFAVADTLPAENWEIVALADYLDDDPARAFQFVRDSIAFEAYPGVLRGAVGTLAARAGNSEDRTVLLAALLDAMGVTYRYATGELDDATAQRVAARTFGAPTKPLDAIDGSSAIHFDTDALASRARRDDALLRLALGDRLAGATGGPAPDLSAEVRHHTWLQVAYGPEWLDEDTTMPDAQPGQTLTKATATPAQLPAADNQTVTVELVDKTLQGGQLTESTVLQQTFGAASATPSEIYLYFQPQLGGLGGTIDEQLGLASSYYPVLLVNGVGQQGTAFPVKPSKDIFSGNVSPTDPVLAGLTLNITVAGPGMTPRTATRTLLDRVPAGLDTGATLTSDKLTPLAGTVGPTVLGDIHHIVVSTGGTSLRAYASQEGAALDFIIRAGQGSPSDYPLDSQLWPMAVGDLGLVMMSERQVVPAAADAPDVRSYIASPRVYVSSIGTDATGSSIDTEMDLMIDGVRIVAPAGSPGGPARAGTTVVRRPPVSPRDAAGHQRSGRSGRERRGLDRCQPRHGPAAHRRWQRTSCDGHRPRGSAAGIAGGAGLRAARGRAGSGERSQGLVDSRSGDR